MAPFKKISRGDMPPNPPRKAHGFAMSSMSLRDMQISKSEKKISWPPLPNPADALAITWFSMMVNFNTSLTTIKASIGLKITYTSVLL